MKIASSGMIIITQIMQTTGEVEEGKKKTKRVENIKTSRGVERAPRKWNSLYKAPTFKLAVILLEICFPSSRTFLSPFMFALLISPRAFSSPYLLFKEKFPLINVQLICMMARNNIFFMA